MIEVDEAHVAEITALFKPEFLVVTNIYRDQLDRYGELDGAAKKVIEACVHAKKIIYYGRDPSLRDIAELPALDIVTFSVDKKYYEALPLDKSQTELTDEGSDYTLIKIQQIENVQHMIIEHKKSSVELSTKLLGAYNALNVLAAYSLANEAGVNSGDRKSCSSRSRATFWSRRNVAV